MKKFLLKVLCVIKGRAEIKPAEYLIDCDAAPFNPFPKAWHVIEHKKGGFWKWNPRIPLYRSKKQKKGSINGPNLREELTGKSVLNANALDYLLSHQYLIPEKWKGKKIYFWGTIYGVNQYLCGVRYLYWNGSKWDGSHFTWTDCGFFPNSPAALAR